MANSKVANSKENNLKTISHWVQLNTADIERVPFPSLSNACLQKGDDHGENHPNVDPFDIRGRQDRLGDPNEAELLFLSHYHLKPISIV